MNGKYLLLERSIRHDLKAIERIYASISRERLADDVEEEELIVLAYRLHNLYNAFENIFENVATTFENALDDSAHWHAQLLERMRLDLSPIRPAVIDGAAYDSLDELRRFRHVFRHAYDVDLDPQRLELVLTKALELKEVCRSQFEAFLDFLQGLQASDR